MDWPVWYNTERVHCAFGNKMTMVQFLLSWKPTEVSSRVALPAERCQMLWTDTPFRLWDDVCEKCGVKTLSGHDPAKGYKVYCEKCYRQEIM